MGLDYEPIYSYIWKQNPDIGDDIWILFSHLHNILDTADESIFIALNEKFPNKSQQEKDEEVKRHHQAMATWTTQREKNLFDQYIKPTLTPLNGIENRLMTVANSLIKEYRKERESQKIAYYKTLTIVALSSLLLISILVICLT